MSGLFDRLAGLRVTIEGHRMELLQQAVSSGFTRVTTVVTLFGGGFEGVGEDITYDEDAHAAALPERSTYALAGTHAFGDFSDLLQSLLPAEGVPHPRWAFEAAVLDLALLQAGETLSGVFGRPSRPVRFVMSTRLASSFSDALLREWVAAVPRSRVQARPAERLDSGAVLVSSFTRSRTRARSRGFGARNCASTSTPCCIAEWESSRLPATHQSTWRTRPSTKALWTP